MKLLAPMLSEGGGKVHVERWLPQKGTIDAEGPPCAKGGGDEEICGGDVNETATVKITAPTPTGDDEGLKERPATPRVSNERIRKTTREQYELFQAEEASAVREWLSARHSLISSQCAHDGFAVPLPDDATQRIAGTHVLHMCTWTCTCTCAHAHAHMHVRACTRGVWRFTVLVTCHRSGAQS